ncbi:hypothetical protein [Colwellia sp. Bg11-12]|uniref:YobI family P-loop NTPase n=1 Tax=Colwellia sp. Bg11-12 TaxID=2759817 RepID=UPI0015F596A4|nr:hypothetical protein [Colwellia sp. Bg11-12]MBA6262828.1 hypothetical protein [Colwellia sp. Bg11-12]
MNDTNSVKDTDFAPNSNVENSQYQALTPVNINDKVYFDSLEFAINNDDIKNVALTGPYGSGKSSIINSFEKKNPNLKFLNISLASFKDESKVLTNEEQKSQDRLIESSILQQMLYGVNANQLNYSRFRRITIPNKDKIQLQSLSFVVWLFLFALAFKLDGFADFIINSGGWGIFFGSCIYSYLLAIPTFFITKLVKSSHNYSFKKISLKNIEIETSGENENSIFNRYLDEIIYFFQATSYNVVVIEDVDRFGSPEVFVKLREINKLINDNSDTTGNIKFLYALKDDMFAHNSRAKFFDFIIPVIPVVNASNSREKINDRLKNTEYKDKIDSVFLREVSWYLSDMRLIHNIFNELFIYYQKLKSDKLNITKLLSVIIYKNIYASDFEGLHHEKGLLYDVCKLKNKLLNERKEDLNIEKNEIQKSITISNKENLRSVAELIRLYLYEIKLIQPNTTHIELNDTPVTLKNCEEIDVFNNILELSNIFVICNGRRSLGKSFKAIENLVDSERTFTQRKESIQNKLLINRQKYNNQRKNIDLEISNLNYWPINKFLIINQDSLDDLLVKNEFENDGLLKYLLLNGHLDDNYYQYTSLFHEGMLSKSDNDYLMTVRNFEQLPTSHRIDNPREVVSELRLSDFSQKCILNTNIVDYLVENKNSQKEKLNLVLSYIKSNFDQSEQFLLSYYNESLQNSVLVSLLSNAWPSFIDSSLASENTTTHLKAILSNVDNEFICDEMNTDNQLTIYLNEFGHCIFDNEIQINVDFSILKMINIVVFNISEYKESPELFDYLHQNHLFKINKKNIDYLINYFTGSSVNKNTLTSSHYTFLLEHGDEQLKLYIEKQLSIYVTEVLLSNEENTSESEEVYLSLLNSNKLSPLQKKSLIRQQDTIIQNINDAPKRFWKSLVFNSKVSPVWENIINLWKSNSDLTDEDLTELFNLEYYAEGLNKSIFPIVEGEDTSLDICRHIINDNNLSDNNYKLLIERLRYNFSSFPEDLSINKYLSLLEHQTVVFNQDTFKFADENGFLPKFIETYEENFFKEKDSYLLNVDNLKALITANIDTKRKIELCYELEASDVQSDIVFIKILAALFVSENIEPSKIGKDILAIVTPFTNSIEESIKLILQYILIWDEQTTLSVLGELEEPYNKISIYGKRPKIENTPINLKLVDVLTKYNYISSSKLSGNKIQINTKQQG